MTDKDKSDEQVVAEWMGVDFYDVYYPSVGGRDDKDTMRKMERKLAENLEMLNEYVGELTGMSGEWSTSDWRDYMVSDNDQRVRAAAETIRRMSHE